jgi:endoglucanase
MDSTVATLVTRSALVLGALLFGCIGTQKPGACPTDTAAQGNAGPAAEQANAPAVSQACPKGLQPAEDGLIDDFEDGNSQIVVMAGRDGYWWKAHDPQGSTIGPESNDGEDGGPSGSTKARHVTGSTSSAQGAWGVNFGANFMAAKGSTFDGSKYVGISFKAMATPQSGKKVRFKVGDVNTHQDPGVCTACWNHFGKDLTLTQDWQEHTVLFSELRQAPGWGKPRPPAISVDKLYNLDWSIGPGEKFDLWVDDIQFIECKP